MSTNRLPLPKPCILDQEQYLFPPTNAAGELLAVIWRLENGKMIRCRMRDIREGDVFLKLQQDGSCCDDCQGYHKADSDAWFELTRQQWGITATYYMDYKPPKKFSSA